MQARVRAAYANSGKSLDAVWDGTAASHRLAVGRRRGRVPRLGAHRAFTLPGGELHQRRCAVDLPGENAGVAVTLEDGDVDGSLPVHADREALGPDDPAVRRQR